jgi:rhodanese-related sulfurtransferase
LVSDAERMSEDTPEAIFARAAERARRMSLPYAGAVTPAEAHRLAEAGAAKIVDVRTPPEWEHVGHVEGAPLVEWPRSGEAGAVAAFVSQVERDYAPDEALLFLCRSGARSHAAAQVLARSGYARAFNILEGFEGAPGTQSGWRAAGLPWKTGDGPPTS